MRLVDTEQFTSGKKVEAFLDDYFQKHGFDIEILTADQERRQHLGDRRFSKDNQDFYVEYKSGIQTFFTGNIFLETISVDATNAPGWVYTCRADYIMYATLLNKKILVFVPDHLRQAIDYLSQHFKTVKTSHAQNDGYNTHGIIVPLIYAEKHLASNVLKL